MAGPRSVFGRALWQRRVSLPAWMAGALIAALVLVSLYPLIRDSAALAELLDRLPPPLMSMLGVDPSTFTTGSGFIQAQLYTLVAPLFLLIFAIGAGSAATAGEEERGTAELQLAYPVGRTRFVLESFAALALHTAALALAFTAALLIGNVAVSLRVPLGVIVGLNLSLWLLGLFFGALALAVGAWSGSRALALGLAATAALAGYFVNGLAPMVASLRGLDRLTPFHWYLGRGLSGSGLQARHAVLAAAVLVLLTLAALAFRQRDLGVRPSPPAWWTRHVQPRLRPSRPASPRFDALLTSVYGKTLWDRRRSFFLWALALWGLSALTIAFWPTLRDNTDQLESLLEMIPPELFAAFGIQDPETLLTPAGFLTARIYGGIGLILVVLFAAAIGISAVATQCDRRTLDLLLATPLTRRRLVLESFAALATLILLLTAGLLPVFLLGNPLADLDLAPLSILAATTSLAATALVFGALALAVGSATGSPAQARGAVALVAIGGFVLNAAGAALPALAPLQYLSPLYWLLGDGPPLARGFSPWLVASLAATTALVVTAMLTFERRDIA